jgi:hypothetical protein
VRIPWVLYAGAAAELLPPIAAATRWKRLGIAPRWIAGWSAFLVLGEVVTLALAFRGVNNHWVNYLGTPLAAALVLWALSHWHPSRSGRRAVRLLIPVQAALWIGMIVLFEDTSTFSVVAEPILGLLVMVAVLSMLVARTMQETGRIRDQNWWWIGLGLMLIFGTTVAFAPAAYILLQQAPYLLMRAYQIRSGLNFVAFLLITAGVLRRPAAES